MAPIDYSRYPPNWKAIRKEILKRDQDKCKFCDVANGSQKEKVDGSGTYTVVLTIAHLDHDETNMAVKHERLAALCQTCHLRYDHQEKIRRKKVKKYKNSLFPIDKK